MVLTPTTGTKKEELTLVVGSFFIICRVKYFEIN